MNELIVRHEGKDALVINAKKSSVQPFVLNGRNEGYLRPVVMEIDRSFNQNADTPMGLPMGTA